MGDHRYAEDRWARVLSAVLQDERRRLALIRDPERAAEVWGFCEGGRAFLRVLAAVVDRLGEQTMQRLFDTFLELYRQVPELVLAAVGFLVQLSRGSGTGPTLDRLAAGMGYRAG